MNCHKCNAPLRPGTKFCTSCGAPVAAPVDNTQPLEHARETPASSAPLNGTAANQGYTGFNQPETAYGQPAPAMSQGQHVQQPAQPMQGQPYQQPGQPMTQPAQPMQGQPMQGQQFQQSGLPYQQQNYQGGMSQDYPYDQPVAPQKKKSAIKLYIIVSAVLAVLLICGVIFWLFSSSKEKPRNWNDENYEEVEMLEEVVPEEVVPEEVIAVETEPEFSDTKPKAQSSGVPYDYTAMVCYRELTPSDLEGCPKKELRLMRNTIYARHGYTFQSPDLQEYFAQFDWYVPTTNVVPEYDMSETELKNIALIKKYE